MTKEWEEFKASLKFMNQSYWLTWHYIEKRKNDID